MLSYISLHQRGWQQHSYVTLDGVAEHAMLHLLSQNNYLSNVVMCLDHDAAGIEATGRLAEILREKGYDRISCMQSAFKDWNEDLKAQHGITPIPAQEHSNATKHEILMTYAHVPYEPERWRKGEKLPAAQGLVVGCKMARGLVTALVDQGDVHALMIGAVGVGKTAKFLYPNLEYACASGMSFMTTDTKGDYWLPPVSKERMNSNY